MRPTHHPGDDFLIAYAAGSLEEPLALVVATHLALCPRCRKEVERLEDLGGVLLQDEDAAALEAGSFERLMARLGEPEQDLDWLAPSKPAADQPKPELQGSADSDAPLLPQPLRGYLGGAMERLDWKSYPGLEEATLLPESSGFRTRLMRIKSGAAMPAHTHKGSELTLVLAGGFSDQQGHYLRGDLAEADPSIEHQPVADPGEDCLCLAVTDAPLHLTGPFGRLLNPFLRI